MRPRWTLFISLLCAVGMPGCSSTILTDVPRPYPFLATYTPYKDLLSRYSNRGTTFTMCDGTSAEGRLLAASPDSIVWQEDGGTRHAAPTKDFSQLRHGSNTIPVIVGASVGLSAFVVNFGFVGSGGGREGPEPVSPSQIIYPGLMGAVLGAGIGALIDVTDTYEVNILSIRTWPDSLRCMP